MVSNRHNHARLNFFQNNENLEELVLEALRAPSDDIYDLNPNQRKNYLRKLGKTWPERKASLKKIEEKEIERRR